MKKTGKLLPFFLVAVLMVAALTVVAAAQTAALPEQCPQCGKAVTWTGLSTLADDAASIAEGHYYMDYEEDTHTWTAEKGISGKVCLYMNGKTLAAKERVFTVNSGGVLSICGEGTLRNGHFAETDRDYGGTVFVRSGGKLILRDATLTDEISDTKMENAMNGGIVCVFGTFDMHSGSITGGKASNAGGNVYIAPAGKMHMYGGSITGGTCSAGKSVMVQGKLLLAGNASINHLYVWEKTVPLGDMITVQGAYTGATTVQYRSITYAEGLDLGAADNASLMRAQLKLYNTTQWYLYVDGTDLKATATAPSYTKEIYCKACGKTEAFSMLTESVAANTELAAGHYYLDLLDSADWAQKTVSGQVCIDLNGQTVQGASRVFKVANGGTLSLQGEGTVNGGGFPTGLEYADRAGGVFHVANGGALNIYGGNYGIVLSSGNTVNPYNGGIVYSTSTVNIYGGKLHCGNVGGVGGSIFMGPAGKLTVSGGQISGETPAACVQGAVLLEKDGTIDRLQLRLKSGGPALGKQLTIKDTYSGTVALQFYDPEADASLVDGGVIGISENADVRHASISVLDSNKAAVSLYVTPQGEELKLSAQAPAAETKDAPCSVCGKTVTWTALTESFSGQETLAAGHYYLDFAGNNGTWAQKTVYGKVCLDLNNQTLHGTTRAFIVESGAEMNLLGKGTVMARGRASSLSTEYRAGGVFYVEADGVLNLYEGTLTYETVSGYKPGNGGILNVIGTFNMYGGEITGGQASNAGGNIFVTATGQMNLLGGSVTNGTCKTGKNVCCRGSVTLAGDASVDDMYLWPDSEGPALGEMLTIQGAYTGTLKVRLGSANLVAGKDVGTSRQADLSGASITSNSSSLSVVTMGTDLVMLGEKPAAVFRGSEVVGVYASVQEAVNSCSEPAHRVVLFAPVQTLEAAKDIYLDLNGFDLGAVTGTGTVYCMDSKTDDFTVEDGDYGTAPADAQIRGVPQGAACAEDGYLMLPGENGTVSFHRLRVTVQSMALRTLNAGIYFTCGFAGDELVKAQIKGFGIALEVNGDPADAEGNTHCVDYESSEFGVDTAVQSLLVYGIMKDTKTTKTNAEHAAMQVNSRAYVELADGRVYGALQGRSLQQQVEGVYDGTALKQVGADGILDGMTTEQRMSLYGMYLKHKDVMDQWNIPNIRETAPADQEALEKAIADNEILQERRAKVVAKMRQMGDLYWRATEDVTYHISANGRWVDFKAGRVYRGIPYAYARSDEQTFLEFAVSQDEKGIYSISGLKEDHLGNGSALARIGNDCSGSVNFAWNQVGADISGTQSSRYMIEANGYLKVGDYEYTPTEDGRVGISKEIVAANGEERMYAAYAKVQPGDALDTTAAAGGHVILVVGKHVVYNPDGSIDPDRSYIHTLEQTPGPVSRGVETHSWNEELGEVVYTIYKEVKSPFRQVYSSGYLPITCKVLIDASDVEEAKVTDSLDASAYTYENLFRGVLTTNRMVSSATMTVSDANGEVFKVTGSGIRAKIKSYDLQNFLTENYEGHMVLRGELALEKLVAGNTYHCTVTVQMGSGETIIARDFDFVATDADISKPDGGTEDPAPDEDEEEEIPDETTSDPQ